MTEPRRPNNMWAFYFSRWLMGFGAIIDGIFAVLTYGLWRPGIEWKIMCWEMDFQFWWRGIKREDQE